MQTPLREEPKAKVRHTKTCQSSPFLLLGESSVTAESIESLFTMAQVIDLGQDTIHLSHSNSGLSLMLRASLDISLAGNLDSRHPEDPEKLINSGFIWIAQSPEIKIHVVATARAYFLESSPSFISHVGDIIRKSRVRYHGPKDTYTGLGSIIH
jgi:hypothetical protein